MDSFARKRDAESRQVKSKAVYVALGVTPDGEREVLGLWIAANEGAKFWLSVMNNLRNRGVEDILIAVTDGLKGLRPFLPRTVPRTVRHLRRTGANSQRPSTQPIPKPPSKLASRGCRKTLVLQLL